VLRVGDERILEAELLLELHVLLHRIGTDADHLRVHTLEGR
jgi:hypothetical protein